MSAQRYIELGPHDKIQPGDQWSMSGVAWSDMVQSEHGRWVATWRGALRFRRPAPPPPGPGPWRQETRPGLSESENRWPASVWCGERYVGSLFVSTQEDLDLILSAPVLAAENDRLKNENARLVAALKAARETLSVAEETKGATK